MNAMSTINTRTSDKKQQKPGDGEVAEHEKVDDETELKIPGGADVVDKTHPDSSKTD